MAHYVFKQNLKADNILVSTSGVCKISGFGVPNARAFTPINGTIFGVAPEAINPREEGYGVEVDIWSLGCIFGELLMRNPLLQGKNEVDQLSKVSFTPSLYRLDRTGTRVVWCN